jgi:(2R)-sulfolactate sulfo-lyase subunit alpha
MRSTGIEAPSLQPPPRASRRRMIHFIVHDENDSVGVVVVEGVRAGQSLEGWIMDQDKTLQLEAREDIPIGHKVAIRDLAGGATVIKYGADIGRAVAPIKVGEHAHVHNLRTKRW